MKIRESHETNLDVAAALAGYSDQFDAVIVVAQNKEGGLHMLYNSEMQLQTSIFLLEQGKYMLLAATLEGKNDAEADT